MTMQEIITTVAIEAGIPPSVLMSRTRAPAVLEARDRIIAEARAKLPNYTLATIGLWFQDKSGRGMHHTSILAAVRRDETRQKNRCTNHPTQESILSDLRP